ncbi:Hydroxyacylglutathione hydrolase [Candidatus Omnitrophus magneticus]|uniref:Hydroxyacylglutathione hydrolase n=1 Tax=Candidatus Omnitrophus magneticus TaxID=1609969 RepID=A0A0F0CV50_9BACT|nr:Hydroxyacylglutathione hydrolase [Candidatus Omnitrophus magneticus]
MKNFYKDKSLSASSIVLGPIHTNAYILEDINSKQAVLIDPSVYDSGVVEYIKKEKLDIIGIINTHGHADHIGGNSSFGYPIFIHEKDKDFLNDISLNLSFLAGITVKSSPSARLLKDGDTVMIGTSSIEVIHTPGHTPGGICLKCGNLLFTGDTLFLESVGRTDCPRGSSQALIKSIKEKLFILPDNTRVLPGHGEFSTIGHEKKHNPFL